MRKSGKKKQADAIDEVEELLKLTQDDLLLKLTVNSHTTSKSKPLFIPESSHSNAIDPDLDRRFQALRSKPKPKPKTDVTPAALNHNEEDVDNLFARFAALKDPNATSSSNSTTDDTNIHVDEEDEVQKIINWAVDAARLDPSPSSDIDDDDDDDDDEDAESDEEESDEDDVAVAPNKIKKKGSKK